MDIKTIGILITIITAIATSSPPCHAAQSTDNNIHITRMSVVYRLNTDKSGRLATIDNNETYVYEARRVEDTARYLTFYNDDLQLRKVSSSAKGTKTAYDQALGNVFYSDSKYCLMKMPVKPGKEVTATSQRRYTNPRHFGRHVIGEAYDVDSATVTIVMPSAVKDHIDITETNMPASYIRTECEQNNGKEWTVTYTFNNLKAHKEEPDSPGFLHYAPIISITDTSQTLEDLYSYLHSFTLHSDPDPEAVNDLAAKLTGGLTDDMDKVRAVNDWVHSNIRYISVEHGEWGQRPDSPSEVIRKRYGDCKGSASLTKALLCASGLDSRLVWIGTTDIPQNWEDTPHMSTGNHMIACVYLPESDEPLFLDGTASYCPAGYIPYGINGKQGLIEDGDSFKLSRVPDINPESHGVDVALDLHLTDSLTLKGTISSVPRGLIRHIRAEQIRTLSESDRNKLFSKLSRNGHDLFKTTSVSETDGVISADIDATSIVSNLGTRTLLAPSPLSWVRDLAIDLKDRHAPAQHSIPSTKSEKFIITIPDGYNAEVPDNATLNTPWAYGSVTFTVENRTITVNASCTNTGQIIPLSDLPDFNREIKRFATALSSNIILTRQ